MKLLNLLNELIDTKHSKNRQVSRIFDNQPFDVLVRFNNGKFRLIAKYTPQSNIIQEIKNDIVYLRKKISNSLSNFNFLVKLYKFNLIDHWNEFDFNDNITDYDIEQIFDELMNNRAKLFLRDKVKPKYYGDTFVSIIRDNKIATTFITEDIPDDQLENKFSYNPTKKQKEQIIVIDKPQDIDQYLDMSPIKSI